MPVVCRVFSAQGHGGFQENNLGKYLLGWIFGVPVVVLVIVYLIFNH
jgi:hypothetical protein